MLLPPTVFANVLYVGVFRLPLPTKCTRCFRKSRHKTLHGRSLHLFDHPTCGEVGIVSDVGHVVDGANGGVGFLEDANDVGLRALSAP